MSVLNFIIANKQMEKGFQLILYEKITIYLHLLPDDKKNLVRGQALFPDKISHSLVCKFHKKNHEAMCLLLFP